MKTKISIWALTRLIKICNGNQYVLARHIPNIVHKYWKEEAEKEKANFDTFKQYLLPYGDNIKIN